MKLSQLFLTGAGVHLKHPECDDYWPSDACAMGAHARHIPSTWIWTTSREQIEVGALATWYLLWYLQAGITAGPQIRALIHAAMEFFVRFCHGTGQQYYSSEAIDAMSDCFMVCVWDRARSAPFSFQVLAVGLQFHSYVRARLGCIVFLEHDWGDVLLLPTLTH